MSLNRTSGIALWRQIQDDIERRIAEGLVKPGDRLPTEHAFARQFGVNRHTVRQAIGALVDRGLLRVEQGRGTFVREPVIDYPLSTRTRFSEIIHGHNRRPAGFLLSQDECQAEPEVTAALALGPGAKVIRLEIAGEVDGQRVYVSTAHYPRARCKGIGDLFAEVGSTTAALQRLGIQDYRRRTTRISARMPSTADAAVLRQARNRPVLVSEAINVDPAGTPIEYRITRFASDWVQFVVDSGDEPVVGG